HITDRNGNEVYVESTPCERVMDSGAADALANAMTADAHIGTAEAAANQMGWNGQIAAKTGTTESNQSAAFLGFNSGLSAAPISTMTAPTLPRCAPAPCASAATGRSSVVPNQLAPSSAWPRSSSRLLVAPSPTMTAPMTAVSPLVFYRPCAAAAKALLANRSRAKPTARAVSQFRMHDIPAPLYALLSAGIGLA